METIFRENGCFVNVNSLSNTCIAKGGSRRGGGGGANTGANVASYSENSLSLAAPSLPQVTSEHACCMLRFYFTDLMAKAPSMPQETSDQHEDTFADHDTH